MQKKEYLFVVCCYLFLFCLHGVSACDLRELPITSTYLIVETPTNNTFISTNVDSWRILFTVYPLSVGGGEGRQHIQLYGSFDYCPTPTSYNYTAKNNGINSVSISILPPSTGNYILYVEAGGGSYAIQACNEDDCEGECEKDCSGNGYCDTASNKCVCTKLWSGDACDRCASCDHASGGNGSKFLIFGSLIISIIVLGVIPFVVLCLATAAIIAYILHNRRKKHHVQPVLVYQNPYQRIPQPQYPE